MVRKNTRNMDYQRKKYRDQCAEEDLPCWLCGMPIDYEAPFNDYSCVLPFPTEEEARAYVDQCRGQLMVRRVDKNQDWDEVHDES